MEGSLNGGTWSYVTKDSKPVKRGRDESDSLLKQAPKFTNQSSISIPLFGVSLPTPSTDSPYSVKAIHKRSKEPVTKTMTLLIVPQPDSQDQNTLPNPVEPLKSTADPQYCAICACPCLTPRLPTAPPDLPDLPLNGADLTLGTPGWLHQYHHLQPSRGILPYPYEPSITTNTFQAYSSPHKHVVPIHLYCLRAVIGITQTGMWNCSSVADDQMMVGWSVPRWTGFGPWVREMAVRPAVGMGWTGLADQKGRFVEGIEGSHLRSVSRLYDL